MANRKFRQKRRPGKRPAPPLNAQVDYLRTLKRILGFARALVEARILPRTARWLGERADARTPQSEQVNNVIEGIRQSIEKKFGDARLADIATGVSEEVSQHQRTEMIRQVGVSLPARSERGLGSLTDAFTHENVALIQSVPGQYLDQVQAAVHSAMSAGMRHEDLAKILTTKLGVAENRAKVIARDQVSKFNGRLTQVRQENMGIVSYIWHTVQDQRVREAHSERDGETFDWSDPPGEPDDPGDFGHPGQAINCRCFAEGIIPGLDDDEETDPDLEPAADVGAGPE